MESIYFQSGEVSHGIKHYMVDTENDKLNLPRDGMLGNRCYVIATKKWYILDGSGEWVPFAAEGGSVDADAILSVIDGMSDSEKSQLRSELGVASVFTFKGTVEEESDLPSIANNAGDVYLVNETSSEYVWIVTSSSGGIEFGRWEKLGSNVSGEPELFFVTFSNQGNTWSADKNITEINAAYNAGKTIVFKYGEYLQFAGKGYEDGSNYYKANIIIDKSTYSFVVADFVGVFVSIHDNITPSDIISATNDMTDEQKAQTRENLDILNSGLSDDVKQSLLDCFNHAAWTDEHGQDYVDALEAALYPLSYITAVYTQSGTVYDTDSLDSLKADLVVTAFYQGGDSKTVTDYTLSGTLTAGTSTITVSYSGKTATFDVTVTAHPIVDWYYPFNGSIASRGTHDFGLTGVQNYAAGVNSGEQCYYHHVGTEGDAATDPLGLYNLACTDFPQWGSNDFTVAFWFKSGANMCGQMFCAEKYIGTTTGLTWSSAPGNIKTGWTVSKSTTNQKHCGLRIGTVNSKLVVSFVVKDVNAGCTCQIEPPSGFDMTQWHHYALTRSGASLYYFVDGNLIFTLALAETTQIYSSGVIAIGNLIKEQSTVAVQPYPYSTYHQDLYVNVGTAKWTSDFDPTDIEY